MYEGLDVFFKMVFVIGLTLVPLGVWKLVEIIVWVFEHVHISI